MMRAWENRSDTVVVDEPLYAYYLKRTGKQHPVAEQVISHGETDWRKVVAQLTRARLPTGKRILFQKQMTHHLLPEIDRDWIVDLTNCFLIRDPREVILSYVRKKPDPSLEDLGFTQQCDLFNFVRERTGTIPPVVDAKDVLIDPEGILRLLCDAIGVEFDKAMLSWPAGLRKTDGIWAKHWYEAVARSTSFEPYQAREGNVPDSLREVYETCRESYERVYKHRLM